ncbi:hypothetical protein EMCRGX_G007609 [Ephydatia muelleri]
MFSEARIHRENTPLDWEPDVEDFEEFLKLLNVIMTTAPECYFDSSDCQKPAGLIGFPINALLDWPMATTAGYAVFANALVNQQFKRILNYWALFLKTPDSRYVLVDNNEHSLAWLSKTALSWIVDLINKALGDKEVGPFDRFEKIFKSNPRDHHPDDDSVIVNACESAPYRLSQNVALSDQFWLKEQRYSLENMLN